MARKPKAKREDVGPDDLKRHDTIPNQRPQGGGTPTWVPTAKQRRAALVLFAKGATFAQVGRTMGVSASTAENHFQEEFREGWEWGNLELYGMLWKQAQKGNIAAIIFLAKNRLGMSDRQDINHGGQLPVNRSEVAIRVEYVLPTVAGALPPPPPERFKGPE